MTEGIGSRIAGWNDSLHPLLRLGIIVLSGLLLVFTVGVITGLTVVMVEHGKVFRPMSLLGLSGSFVVAAALGWLLWQLTSHWRRPGRSAFDRRYTRMWLVLLALGIPIGILLGVLNGNRSTGQMPALFGNDPIGPGTALGAAIGLLGVLSLSAVYYHRIIDDHEERAYLWASTMALYFIAAALPVAWLLARGGIIDPVGIGTAMLILLASFVLQTLVWAWFKFR